MKITEKEVRYVAALANLNLNDAEVAKFRTDLDGILEHIEKLSEVDVSNVAPMAQVLVEQSDPLREDVPETPLGSTVALANAPQSGPAYFKVPKVVER
jgi:aspartyl-tRNA(Asn)/glutamyl-tRNA(Gln) amidotransferase subunit C